MNCYSIYYSRDAAPFTVCHLYVYALDEKSSEKKLLTMHPDVTIKQIRLHERAEQCAPEFVE